MATMTTENRMQRERWEQEWEEAYPLSERLTEWVRPSWGVVLAGLAIAGVGLWLWRTFGPDPRRYLKIERM
jgi:hypothetical protein